MNTPRIIAIAGSLRADSFNRRLVEVAASGARAAGAEVTTVDLRDWRLPLFDEDLEQQEGPPENLGPLKDLFIAHDGLLVASPEYNSSISAVLKNTIDWVSRPREGDPGLAGLAGKVAGVMATSPGALGGLRGLVHIRAILGNLRMLVIPDQIAVPKAYEAFSDDGRLVDEKRQAAVQAIGAEVARVAAVLV